jgi:aryl-alcohol dehydrogenase-like predicted oxidoreductase
LTTATAEGTARYAERLPGLPPAHFRRLGALTLSSVGVGTYLGRPDDATDASYAEAIAAALQGGLNLVDTAVNYRHGRSERAVGKALSAAFAAGIARDEVVVATKGGYSPSPDPEYMKGLVNQGLMAAADVVSGIHCLAPEYLRHQLSTSLRNLGLPAVDVYYVHNPEQQLEEADPREFLRRVRRAFELLEAEAGAGRIGCYGTATWNGYRVARGTRGWLSLEGLVQIARDVAGDAHHFRVVQLPANLAMTEAYGDPTQVVEGVEMALLDAAQRLGIAVVTSAPLLQGRLARSVPPELDAAFPGLDTGAQRAVQFARSLPGVTATLVGMSRVEHVQEALGLARVAPVSPDRVRSLFSAG